MMMAIIIFIIVIILMVLFSLPLGFRFSGKDSIEFFHIAYLSDGQERKGKGDQRE